MDIGGLVRFAEGRNIGVHWDRGLPVEACWFEAHRLIVVRDGMTTRRTRSVLAHELGHAAHGDWCSAPKAERRAWAYAARLLISPVEFALAVSMHGPHAGAVARELDVLADVVHAHWDARRADYTTIA